MWNQTLALQIHTPPVGVGGRGKQRSGPIGAWAKIGKHQDWRSHPNPPFCIQTNCYFHILCYTQQFANSMQNIITAFQSHGCTFYQNGQMGRRCQLGCPPYVEPNSGTANPHPFESSGQIDYPLALALDDSEVAESLELLDWWIARKHLAHFWAFSGMVVTNL